MPIAFSVEKIKIFSPCLDYSLILTKLWIYVKLNTMNRFMSYIALFLVFSFILSGCATLKKKTTKLSHGLTKAQVIELWGEPKEKVKLGLSKNNYPVEAWEYYQQAIPLLRKEEDCVLIFVDSELYTWVINNPEAIFKEMVKLGVFKERISEFSYQQYQKSLQDSAIQAIETRKTMEVIRSYQFYQNTQRDIQTMQQIRTMQQQQMRPPPPPPQRPQQPLRKQ